MLIFPSYLVGPNTTLLADQYYLYGSLYTRVYEGRKPFLVSMASKKIIDFTLKHHGSNLRGAIESAKFLLGKKYMCPIIVNPVQNICMLRLYSPAQGIHIWFNLDHIWKADRINNKTVVILIHGFSIEVDLRLASLNKRLDKARELKRISRDNGNSQIPIDYKPENLPLITLEENGFYNFNILEDEQE